MGLIVKDAIVERFLKEALPIICEKINPLVVIIFGSRISGRAQKDSDLDVIVVSRYFENMSFLERIPLLVKLVNFDRHIDFLCYTPEEFKRIKKSSVIVEEAVKNGLIAYSSSVAKAVLQTRRNRTEVLKIIKNEVQNAVAEMGYHLDKIVLFGSRARDNYEESSDWDILVIVKDKLDRKEKTSLFVAINRRLAEHLIPCDVLVRTSEDVEKLKKQVHSTTKAALEEGIVL